MRRILVLISVLTAVAVGVYLWLTPKLNSRPGTGAQTLGGMSPSPRHYAPDAQQFDAANRFVRGTTSPREPNASNAIPDRVARLMGRFTEPPPWDWVATLTAADKPLLLAILESPTNLWAKTAAAYGLAVLGDETAVGVLTNILSRDHGGPPRAMDQRRRSMPSVLCWAPWAFSRTTRMQRMLSSRRVRAPPFGNNAQNGQPNMSRIICASCWVIVWGRLGTAGGRTGLNSFRNWTPRP